MHTLTSVADGLVPAVTLATETVSPVGETVSGGIFAVAPLLVGLPLASAAILLLLGRRADRWGHWLGVLASGGAFVVGLLTFLRILDRPADERVLDVHLGTWIDAGAFHLDAGMRLDPLSLTFVLLVTFVGTLIHVYSVAYMDHDADRRRFFAYLNLFVAAMLVLVLADSFLLLFVGWEGVGLASYLLIGFWNHHMPYAVAAKKAFVANRIGDVGLLIAMGLMFAHFGALDFATVLDDPGAHASEGTLTAIGLMLLLAACGKSAQFPLQSWLGDAMAGPTPVSALIHAATMVTAGVYLIVRSGGVFEAAPTAQLVVVIIGAITLLFGAIVGCAKDDIKKALAASTMSQIGYMVLAAGLGPIGYAFAIFHLVTHGFFKAGMFLGAGSVMHGMDDQVDMRRFGGLAPYMKITWITFMMGWLAILGIPPFAGFFSKDKIIEAAFIPTDGAQWRAWVFGTVTLLGAGITAFYMSRLFFMTFEGERRWTTKKDGSEQHPHESPALMTWPMIILAVGSVGLGLVLSLGGRFVGWLEPVTGHAEHGEPVLPAWLLIALTLTVVIAGLVLAWRRYAVSTVPVVPPLGTSLTRAARVDLYQDAVNDAVLVEPGQHLTRSLVYADHAVVDGGVKGLAHSTVGLGSLLRRAQTGYVRTYAATMLGGLLVLLVVVLVVQS
ncbi:MAG: NADH-quinone oxidoreductase subunit L [Cellulomonas sp.]|uniref:NADH-quinone oxidoreductase subunit L n=1 Tax=Cellulomonas gelida TaxID=1712 RepID=A0A4Y3KPQ0_9CELL|nr:MULTISPECIES: NADH-quinone oxidoreductase subunit L [Cellulomonas]KMM46712.1 NADH-quinone oxidoreductase subunit L [Cellulomonas sp. A375-1]MCR6648377.1 NADH-quinone oxidoreductase subunit L [Cellulomonas sp.]MCR6704326.1 NADH-quinone oxidoreductase subunit L [Cellulomonas sp.]GEA84910.1 NADH-quinone oxidoreductase subunit L [Cellulomonas gelida]GGL31164.1 NADH-quinone oxidoreductase subunit L [Cellulomonas gelida]